MLQLIAVFQLAAAAPAASVSLPRDSAAIVQQLRDETADFLWVWRFYWKASEAMRHEIRGSVFPLGWEPTHVMRSGRGVRDRLNHLHCHPDGRGGYQVLSSMLREGGRSLRAMCPDWMLGKSVSSDERVSLDDALVPPLRSGARVGRDDLLADLERGARELPADSWIAGQRVRFAVDQRDSAQALRATADCKASRWWCAALGGYARYSMGDAAGADSMFELSLSSMSRADRCEWDNLSDLLDESGQEAYDSIPCERRDSINARIWWLADPLYSEPRNERRAEHFSRLVTIALRSSVVPAERWSWRKGDGGLSLREMLVRYGWPTQSWWAGPVEDDSHYSYLGIRDSRTKSLGVFTTQEYTRSRFHTVPEWSAVTDPFHATPAAWDIAAPREPDGTADPEWWPQEHYARDVGDLVPIVEAQTAILRRGDDLELAVASDLTRVALDRATARTATSTLIVTPSPDVLELSSAPVSLDSTAVWRASIRPEPAIVGVEARSVEKRASAARMRFGIDPPPPLSVMHPGDLAVSVPVLVRAPDPNELPSADPDKAVRAMLGSTLLRGVTRLGVYWETYGAAPGDSVDVAVRIDRLGSPSIFRRIGNALRIAARLDGSATVRWREPKAGIVTSTFGDAVPIQGRNVSVDLSRLAADKYRVTVSVTRGQQTVSASRDFEIAGR